MDEKNRQEIMETVAKGGAVRHKLFIRLIEGKVSDDNITTRREVINVVDENSVPRSIELSSALKCDFGHFQDQRVRVLNQCERCGKYTCSTVEDNVRCSYSCVHCGIAICRNCATLLHKKDAFCPKCSWRKYVAILREAIKKVVK